MSRHRPSQCDTLRHHPALARLAVVALLAALLVTGQVQAGVQASVQPHIHVYRIQSGPLVIGASRIVWQTRGDGRRSDAIVHIADMLDQHQHLQLDAAGLPSRYDLEASVQGHRTTIAVRRQAGQIVETVHQDGHVSTTHLPCPQPVDWLDNNSFDSLQALLDRHRGRLKPGTTLRVFVPQARTFGRFKILSARMEAPAAGSTSRHILRLKTELTVANHPVQLVLDIDTASGQLLRYRQPQLNVTVTRVPGTLPVP